MEKIRKFIEKEYGKKCPDYEDGCCVCRIWFLFENLKEYIDLGDEDEKS